jgi:hypothetical protein
VVKTLGRERTAGKMGGWSWSAGESCVGMRVALAYMLFAMAVVAPPAHVAATVMG